MVWRGHDSPAAVSATCLTHLSPLPSPVQLMRLNATEETLRELSSEMSTAFCALAEVYLTDLWSAPDATLLDRHTLCCCSCEFVLPKHGTCRVLPCVVTLHAHAFPHAPPPVTCPTTNTTTTHRTSAHPRPRSVCVQRCGGCAADVSCVDGKGTGGRLEQHAGPTDSRHDSRQHAGF